MTASETKVIAINLDNSDHNSAINVGELIQQACYDKLKAKIQSEIEKTKKDHRYHDGVLNGSHHGEYPPGSGLVYFIDGTRGAGKSTFLKTAYDALPCGQNDKEYQIENLMQLAYIDPSRIENNEIILLGILKSLAEKIECKRRQTSCLGDESNDKIFRESFKKIAGGLSLFAKDYHPLQNLDPELFLDYGLERAGHSKDLRRHLHKLFDTACALLGADALLLAFDDADTNSQHARALLECIRNYLDTPRLVILVTGDMELYSLLVRDHFFDNLSHSLYDKDEERRQQRVRMVDHLEDQYLLKLFPIQRRTQLRPLGNLLAANKVQQYILQSSHWNNSNMLSERKPVEALNELIRRGLRIRNSADVKLYREFILQQPLRSVLQLLSNCAPYLSHSDEIGAKNVDWETQKLSDAHNEEESTRENPPGNLSDALRESLRGMALGSLYKFGVDVDALAHNDLPALIDAVFELSLRDGDTDTAAYLRPQTREDSLKNCFTALAAEVAAQCVDSPSSAIRYMLGGPGSVSLFGKELLRNSEAEKTKGIDREELKKQFQQYMGVGRRDNALEWARHATAVIASTHTVGNKLIEFGVFCLNKNKGKKDNNRSYDNYFNTTKKEINTFALSLIDLSGATAGTSYASIFNILGIIERLFDDDLNRILKKPYPPLSVSRPIWGGKWTSKSDESEVEENVGSSFNIPETLNNAIVKWKENVNLIKIAPSSVLLGKIWTRLYFSLEKSADALRPDGEKMKGAATIMEIFALCVINAFLVEEAEHHLINNEDDTLLVDRTNPQTSASDFIKIKKKIEFIANNKDKLPLSYAIASCPLILGLIQPTIDAIKSFSILLGITENKTKELLCSDVDWDAINSFFIAGRVYKDKKSEKLTEKLSTNGENQLPETSTTGGTPTTDATN